jgi:hypothetical protein
LILMSAFAIPTRVNKQAIEIAVLTVILSIALGILLLIRFVCVMGDAAKFWCS